MQVVKDYGWESVSDAGRDLDEAIECLVPENEGEWKGTVRVTVEYLPE